MGEKIAVAMSGGVDSSVAALLLKKQGYDVVGIMFEPWSEDADSPQAHTIRISQKDAEKIANRLDIPFHLIDCKKQFEETVVQYFIDSYARCITPNPCIVCNRLIKFGRLLEEAGNMGADRLATGHYVNLVKEKGSYHILKGDDPRKDQSYFLYRLNQDQLSRLVFPMGRYRKEEVRKIAKENRLPVACKSESQDICFIEGGDYRGFLHRCGKAADSRGPIVTSKGEVLGEHRGLTRYTVGQRRGLGISYREPLYVLALRGDSNALVVGTAAERGKRSLSATNLSFTSGKIPQSPIDIEVKVRYSAMGTKAKLMPLGRNLARLEFERPIPDITPGQSAVFYRNDRLLGGGIILP